MTNEEAIDFNKMHLSKDTSFFWNAFDYVFVALLPHNPQYFQQDLIISALNCLLEILWMLAI